MKIGLIDVDGHNFPNLWHCIRAELIGEVAFHTQEEAEQALERMKEVQDVN